MTALLFNKNGQLYGAGFFDFNKTYIPQELHVVSKRAGKMPLCRRYRMENIAECELSIADSMGSGLKILSCPNSKPETRLSIYTVSEIRFLI